MSRADKWEAKVRGYSYAQTAETYKAVQRLAPRDSLLYAIIANELCRKASIVFTKVARKRITPVHREGFVATCMAKMVQGIDRFSPGNFYSWLATIAEHEATDRWRKRERRQKTIPAIVSLEEMQEAQIGSRDRAEHDAATVVDDYAEEEMIVADFLRRVEERFGSTTRGVLEMKMSGVPEPRIADYYGLEPLGVGVILKRIGDFYREYAYCAA